MEMVIQGEIRDNLVTTEGRQEFLTVLFLFYFSLGLDFLNINGTPQRLSSPAGNSYRVRDVCRVDGAIDKVGARFQQSDKKTRACRWGR
jgi:hypothetical protein